MNDNISEPNPEDTGILEDEKKNEKLFESNLKDNAESLQVSDEKKSKTLTKQISTKAIVKGSSEKIELKSKEDKDLANNSYIEKKQKMETPTEQSIDDRDLDDSARGKSTDLSSTESRTSMLNAEDTLSPERTDSFREKKSDYSPQEDDREQLEDERGKFLIVYVYIKS